MPVFKFGDRMCHPAYGEGTVTVVGANYVGIDFNEKGDALLRTESSVKSLGVVLRKDA